MRRGSPGRSRRHPGLERFFVFPDLLRGLGSEERIAAFTTRALELFGKAVLIAPSDRATTRLVAAVVPEQMPVWQPEEFAEAPEEFAEAPGGVLALANRYDGIDLPDEACRLVVLAGLPVGMHLQERFLHESVKALAVLTERIRTRLTQGAGRATSNSADYAAVIMLGRDLANFCAQPGVQAASHPEIRAELCFGLDNSTGTQAREAMAAGICVEAGADEFAIDGWAEVGAELQAQAAIPPAGVRVI